jgi:hypothetical protein
MAAGAVPQRALTREQYRFTCQTNKFLKVPGARSQVVMSCAVFAIFFESLWAPVNPAPLEPRGDGKRQNSVKVAVSKRAGSEPPLKPIWLRAHVFADINTIWLH